MEGKSMFAINYYPLIYFEFSIFLFFTRKSVLDYLWDLQVHPSCIHLHSSLLVKYFHIICTIHLMDISSHSWVFQELLNQLHCLCDRKVVNNSQMNPLVCSTQKIGMTHMVVRVTEKANIRLETFSVKIN